MTFELHSPNRIVISDTEIIFPDQTEIDKVIEIGDKIVLNTSPSESEIDWTNVASHELWKKVVKENPPKIYAYSNSGEIVWDFDEEPVVGFEIEIPEEKFESEFTTSDAFKIYMDKFGGKKLLIVHAGDYRYRLDAHTGEVYEKSETR